MSPDSVAEGPAWGAGKGGGVKRISRDWWRAPKPLSHQGVSEMKRNGFPVDRLAERLGGNDYLVIDHASPISAEKRDEIVDLAFALYKATMPFRVMLIQMGPETNLDADLGMLETEADRRQRLADALASREEAV